MRSRTSHAAKSGVGEHKARESESAQHCADGKECVASTHPQIWPWNRKVSGPYFLQPPNGGASVLLAYGLWEVNVGPLF